MRFGAPQAPPAHPVIGPQEDWFVSMVTSDGAAPTFTYGSTGVFQGASRVFVTLGNLDPASAVNDDGSITLVLPKSAIGNPGPGQAISSIFGSVRATVPSAVPGTGGTNETIPDSTGTGSYALRPANPLRRKRNPRANKQLVLALAGASCAYRRLRCFERGCAVS